MLGPWLCPREGGVTDPALPVPGASIWSCRLGAHGPGSHKVSVSKGHGTHFLFPRDSVIPSHCESPFRRDFPLGLTQAASRPVTQAGALPAQPHILHCSVQMAEPGIGAGKSLPDPQWRPTAAPAKVKHELGVVLQACDLGTLENQ